MVKIYPYKPYSASAKSLAEGLGIKRLKHQGSLWRPRRATDVVINWGSTNPLPYNCVVLNRPELVSAASNKLSCFELMARHGVRIPEWTRDSILCQEWLNDDSIVVGRRLLNSHSGKGIVLMQNINDFVPCPLYVKYKPKKDEYRVHVMRGNAFDIQRKKRIHDVPDEEVNWKIRNMSTGFTFGRADIQPPEDVYSQAVNAILAIPELDFGAVDIIWNEHENTAYVLEINTAPGLVGTTLNKYVEEFRRILCVKC